MAKSAEQYIYDTIDNIRSMIDSSYVVYSQETHNINKEIHDKFNAEIEKIDKLEKGKKKAAQKIFNKFIGEYLNE